ncbi:MAG TPA: hypothetical protein EYQ27_15185 [Gemmatimonadetes bacterium]|nr:hypothetical protein [Gemmatimonadota bacterium]
MTNTISNANRTWNVDPYCTWDVTDPAGKYIGHIEALFESKEQFRPYTYYVDTYEVNVGTDYENVGSRHFVVRAPFKGEWGPEYLFPARVRLRRHQERLHLEGIHGVGQFEIHPTARKALAAAKKFARAYTANSEGAQV